LNDGYGISCRTEKPTALAAAAIQLANAIAGIHCIRNRFSNLVALAISRSRDIAAIHDGLHSKLEDKRVTTWQRQWGGGKLKHGFFTSRLI
jgi:hypothetical protein